MEFQVTGNLVNVIDGEIYAAEVTVADGRVKSVTRLADQTDVSGYLLPGFVDSHIHVESSMLLPAEFARTAVTHGTVATVSDPHEIANVCGLDGVELMLRNAANVNFKFCFGAPSCVPATNFETSGATLDSAAVAQLLKDARIGYLSEMMNFPGVLAGDSEVMAKIKSAQTANKPVDGHAPGLRSETAAKYVSAGITTDHECVTLEEALDKINAGCRIAIREGSAARNFEALESLIDTHPEFVMLCSDDKHPDEFLTGHINKLVSRAVANGRDLMNTLRAACLNPVRHYNLDVGILQPGDPADFIRVTDLESFQVEKTWINGQLVSENGNCLIERCEPEIVNQFAAKEIEPSHLHLKAPSDTCKVNVIEAMDGELITNRIIRECKVEDGLAIADPESDILKIVVVNRYQPSKPAVAFVSGFHMKQGALASSVAHDSHNIVAVGTSDEALAEVINAVIRERGGLSVINANEVHVLPLPVAGLMSTGTCQEVGERYGKLDAVAKANGCTLRAPFMTLSFMALLVIPSLKLSDRGLFDVDRFEFVSLFSEP